MSQIRFAEEAWEENQPQVSHKQNWKSGKKILRLEGIPAGIPPQGSGSIPFSRSKQPAVPAAGRQKPVKKFVPEAAQV